MKYKDSMSNEDKEKLLKEVQALETPYRDNPIPPVEDSDVLQWWTEKELRMMDGRR